jgi:hypothetical protein
MKEFLIKLFSQSKNSKSSWITSILTASLLAVALFKFSGRFKKDRTGDYIAAVTTFAKWEKEDEQSDLEKLKRLMHQQPELKTKFEASIAQRLLLQKKGGEAASFVMEVLRRDQKRASPFHQFAAISLMIARDELSQAREESKKLQESIEGKDEFGLLEAYNLLRLALLDQEAGLKREELEEWDTLKKHPHFMQIDQSLTKGELSLSDYIEYRRTTLTSL